MAAADELERRRPVWEAMSEFFLDTELDSADHNRIAQILIESGYSMDQLERILWRELCPVLGANLLPVAGEWKGFNMQSVEQQILQRPSGRLRSWWSRVSGGRMANHSWQPVRAILAKRQD
jgi:hypothetical protein